MLIKQGEKKRNFTRLCCHINQGSVCVCFGDIVLKENCNINRVRGTAVVHLRGHVSLLLQDFFKHCVFMIELHMLGIKTRTGDLQSINALTSLSTNRDL